MTEGIDYTVSYADNVYVNTEATVVINFTGNYDGTFRKWFTITQDPKTTEFDGECIGNGELPDSRVSQTTNSSTGYDLSLPMHVYQNLPETETPAVEFVGQQIDISSGILMKFYVRNNEDRPIESICVEVEFLGKLTYLTECEEHPTEAKVYIYTFEDINPQCLGDPMNVVILVGGIPVAHENARLMDYSVEKNLLEIRKTADDLTVQLIDDLLAYGEAASIYKDNQTMTGNTYTENSSNREIPVSEADRFEIEPNYPLVEQYTVRFGTTLSIKIKVSYLPKVKVYVNGKEYVTTEEDRMNGWILFENAPISTTDFDKDFSVIIQNGEGETYSYIHGSVNDYLYAISQSTDASDEMKAFAKALYNYGYSAKVYPHLSQKDDNHLFVYTVNEDRTHTGICVCGEEVTEEHNVSSTTGVCSICNAFVAAASITIDTVKTYYSTFEEAVAYANGKDGTVIVIENDCTVNGKVDFESGSVMIDLNGKEIDSTSNYIFYYAGGSITIRDSVGEGRTVQSVDGSTVIIEGGTHAKNVGGNNLIVTGGNFSYVAVTTGETATISGGSFEEIRIHSSVGSLADMLADGYCFYDKNGNVVDTSTIQADSRNWYNLYNVTVGAINEN